MLYLPRALGKALFSHTPLLDTVKLNASIDISLRGLLDAGLRALPLLRRVRFPDFTPDDVSVEEDPDPIPPLMRRFLHRFPLVTVRLDIDEDQWQDPDQLSAMLARYLGWPRLELYWAHSNERIGVPLSPHASDDEEGSDVEDLADPLATAAH